jgi:hypothetical protein
MWLTRPTTIYDINMDGAEQANGLPAMECAAGSGRLKVALRVSTANWDIGYRAHSDVCVFSPGFI